MSRGRRLIPERREAATTLQKAATILAIVCLTCGAVLTISFVLSWFRVIGAGRFKTYYTFRGQDLPSMSIEIFRGKFVYSHNEGWIPDTVRPPPRWQYAWWFAPPQNMQRGQSPAVTWVDLPDSFIWDQDLLRVPLWPAILLLLGFPTTWFVLRRRIETKGDRAHCVACGYDLRATPDRCPECGREERQSRPAKML